MKIIKSSRLLRPLLLVVTLIAVVPHCPVDSQNQRVYLTRLAISSGTLVPRFRPDVTDYAVAVEPSVRELSVTVNAGHGAPSIRARVNAGEWIAVHQGRPSPALSLNTGTNPIEIEVAAEGLNTNTYTVVVERAAPGSIDAGFDTGSIRTRVALGGSWPLAVQSDGKILVGGDFSRYSDYSRFNISRLNTDGLVDRSFNAGADIGPLAMIALQSDQKILIAGWFDSHSGVARLNSDGTPDSSFDTGTGVGPEPWEYVTCLALQANGKILVGGWFESYSDCTRMDLARLNTDGSLDGTFDPDSGLAGMLRIAHVLDVQPDGKILVGGNTFSSDWSGVARLNPDGSLDTRFQPGTGVNGNVKAIAVQPDGKIVIGGTFDTFNGSARSGIARLNADGSLDTGFNPGRGVESTFTSEPPGIKAIALQADGKLIVGGYFTAYDGTARSNLARLNTDGSLDAEFDPGNTAGSVNPEFVDALAIQADGKVLVGGHFWLNYMLPNIVCRVWGD